MSPTRMMTAKYSRAPPMVSGFPKMASGRCFQSQPPCTHTQSTYTRERVVFAAAGTTKGEGVHPQTLNTVYCAAHHTLHHTRARSPLIPMLPTTAYTNVPIPARPLVQTSPFLRVHSSTHQRINQCSHIAVRRRGLTDFFIEFFYLRRNMLSNAYALLRV